MGEKRTSLFFPLVSVRDAILIMVQYVGHEGLSVLRCYRANHMDDLFHKVCRIGHGCTQYIAHPFMAIGKRIEPIALLIKVCQILLILV